MRTWWKVNRLYYESRKFKHLALWYPSGWLISLFFYFSVKVSNSLIIKTLFNLINNVNSNIYDWFLLEQLFFVRSTTPAIFHYYKMTNKQNWWIKLMILQVTSTVYVYVEYKKEIVWKIFLLYYSLSFSLFRSKSSWLIWVFDLLLTFVYSTLHYTFPIYQTHILVSVFRSLEDSTIQLCVVGIGIS